MRQLCLTLFLALTATSVFAQGDTIVRWRGIQGVISAPGVDNPVGQIRSGAGPWTTQGGNARINLTTGEGSFEVEGLVMNGGNASGTPGPVVNAFLNKPELISVTGVLQRDGRRYRLYDPREVRLLSLDED